MSLLRKCLLLSLRISIDRRRHMLLAVVRPDHIGNAHADIHRAGHDAGIGSHRLSDTRCHFLADFAALFDEIDACFTQNIHDSGTRIADARSQLVDRADDIDGVRRAHIGRPAPLDRDQFRDQPDQRGHSHQCGQTIAGIFYAGR